jgi:hypothetical protein
MSWSMGASTTQQLLAAGLADELLLHIAPKGPPERAPSRRRLMALATLQEGSLSMRSHSVNTEIGWLFPRLCSKVSRSGHRSLGRPRQEIRRSKNVESG